MSISFPLKNANKIYTLLLSIIKRCQLIPEKYFSNLINSHCLQDSFLEPSSSFNHNGTKTDVSVHTVAPSSLSITQKIIQVPSLLFWDSQSVPWDFPVHLEGYRHFTCPCDPLMSVPWPPFHLLSPSPVTLLFLQILKEGKLLALSRALLLYVLCQNILLT